jgi:hypothetical protein
MRKLVRAAAAVAIAGAGVLGAAGTASAHVHGFTPLLCLTVDSPSSGAFVGFEQAADAAAPLQGPTGIIPQNASGSLPSGGQGAANACP